MDAALRWRKRAFLIYGGIWLFLLMSSAALGKVLEKDSDPDLLTVIAWVLVVPATAASSYWFFRRSQVRKARELMMEKKGAVSLEEMGKALSFLATTFAFMPMSMGLVLFVISGDPWRMYIFLPITVASGIVLWQRIESALEELDH